MKQRLFPRLHAPRMIPLIINAAVSNQAVIDHSHLLLLLIGVRGNTFSYLRPRNAGQLSTNRRSDMQLEQKIIRQKIAGKADVLRHSI
jgi:hypothetical protein